MLFMYPRQELRCIKTRRERRSVVPLATHFYVPPVAAHDSGPWDPELPLVEGANNAFDRRVFSRAGHIHDRIEFPGRAIAWFCTFVNEEDGVFQEREERGCRFRLMVLNCLCFGAIVRH